MQRHHGSSNLNEPVAEDGGMVVYKGTSIAQIAAQMDAPSPPPMPMPRWSLREILVFSRHIVSFHPIQNKPRNMRGMAVDFVLGSAAGDA